MPRSCRGFRLQAARQPSKFCPCICQNSACRDLKLIALILPQLTSLLISPWVSNGSAVQEPKGPTKTSQFELSSVPATVKTLFNLTSFLTKRDA